MPGRPFKNNVGRKTAEGKKSPLKATSKDLGLGGARKGIMPPYKVMGVYLGRSQEILSRLKAEAGCHRDVLKEKCFLLKKK